MSGRGFSRRRRRSRRTHSPPDRSPLRSVRRRSRFRLPPGLKRTTRRRAARQPASRISARTSRSSSSSRSEKSRCSRDSRSLHVRRANGCCGSWSEPASLRGTTGRKVACRTGDCCFRSIIPGSRARVHRSGGVSQKSAKAASKSSRSSRRWMSSARAAAWNSSRRKTSMSGSACARSSIRAVDTGSPIPRSRRPKSVRFWSSGGSAAPAPDC